MIIIIAILFSCNAEKKAIRQTHNALLKYPTVVAKIARDAFPCHVIRTENKIDSADFKLWKDSVDILNVFYTDLFNHIQPVLIHDTTNSCNAYKDNDASGPIESVLNSSNQQFAPALIPARTVPFS